VFKIILYIYFLFVSIVLGIAVNDGAVAPTILFLTLGFLPAFYFSGASERFNHFVDNCKWL
jgi:hypothetical protein